MKRIGWLLRWGNTITNTVQKTIWGIGHCGKVSDGYFALLTPNARLAKIESGNVEVDGQQFTQIKPTRKRETRNNITAGTSEVPWLNDSRAEMVKLGSS